MHIIIFKEKGDDLNLDTRYIGPFSDIDEAYNHLCTLPPVQQGGHKYIIELESPKETSR